MTTAYKHDFELMTFQKFEVTSSKSQISLFGLLLLEYYDSLFTDMTPNICHHGEKLTVHAYLACIAHVTCQIYYIKHIYISSFGVIAGSEGHIYI